MLNETLSSHCDCPADCISVEFTLSKSSAKIDPGHYCDSTEDEQSDANVQFVDETTKHSRSGVDGLFYKYLRYAKDGVFLAWPDMEKSHDRCLEILFMLRSQNALTGFQVRK